MKMRESFLFLIELMISILIFFGVAAICLLIFSKAHRMNRSSQELNTASRAEANLAELVSSAGSVEEAENRIKEVCPEAEFSDLTGESGVALVIPYDSHLRRTDKQAAYQLTAVIQMESEMLHADMHFYPVDEKGQKTGDSVYDLVTRNVIPITEAEKAE